MSHRFHSILYILSLSIWLALSGTSTGYGFERKQPVPLPPCAVSQPVFWQNGGPGFCTIQYDSGQPTYYFDQFGSGDGIAVYMDPDTCGFENTYPFKITNVHLYLHGPEAFVWPVEIKVSVLNVDTLIDTTGEVPDTLTPVPGRSQYNQIFTIDEDSTYDPDSPEDPMNLTLDESFCVTAPFFLEIVYTGGTEPLYPGLVMGDISDLPEVNRNWVLWNRNYYEWYDFWLPWAVPGRAIMRITGYPYAIDCDKLCWKWLPEGSKAPNGMPDLDQYQFGPDSAAMCGPTAMANCLLWLNAIPSIADPDSLIRLLSHYLYTDPSTDGGTLVDSISSGLDSLFSDYGLSFYDSIVYNPEFTAMADWAAKSTCVTLLIGLWQEIDHTWFRIGGHYVSLAGACKAESWAALSDPAADGAERGARGRFLPPHEVHPDDHTLHNTRGFISHDAYTSSTLSIFSEAESWVLRDIQSEDLPWVSQFEGLNFQPGQDYRIYDPAESLYAAVEYAILILEKPTHLEEEQAATPLNFQLFQSYPNPFNNKTVIRYSLSRPTEVSLVIYNILGQKVRTLVKGQTQQGLMSTYWDGKDQQGNDLGSGIYFYRLQAGEFSETRRMVLLK